MRATVKWIDGALFLGESGSGHTVAMDGAPEVGGRNLGLRPMETVLVGLGGCTASDVVSILRKARQPVSRCEVHMEAERAESVPKIFTRIHLRYVVEGYPLGEPQVRRAVALSAEKYCSVTAMMRYFAAVTHEYEIRTPPA